MPHQAGKPESGRLAPEARRRGHELLCDLIGVSEAEYRSLETDGIIGTVYAEDAT